MKLQKLQLFAGCFAIASVILSPSYSYAKKKKRHQPPAEVVRALRLTTDCERSVLGMLAPDVALSSTARQLGMAFSMEYVKHNLRILTGDLVFTGGFKLEERASDEGRAITRQIIQYYLRGLGLEPKLELFKDGANVVAEITGSEFPDEVLEVGAHFDSAGESVPGADDNGSGFSLALQMVGYFQEAKPKRTIRFVFYDLEEEGAKGSKAHVQLIKNDPRLFLGAIVIDMIGYRPEEAKNFLAVAEIGEAPRDGDNGPSARWRRSLHQLAQAMFFQYGRYQQDRRLILSPERETAKPSTGDHGSYWDAKLPAIFIAAPYEGDYVNPENHGSGDTIENIDWDYFTEVSRFVVEAVAWISGATVVPAGADPGEQTDRADSSILLEAAATLIPAKPAEREPDLIKSRPSSIPISSESGPSFDEPLYEEVEELLDQALSGSEETNLTKLWSENGSAVLLLNDRKDKGLLLFAKGGQWILRNQKWINFILSELRNYKGFYATTGTVDPMYMGAKAKDDIRSWIRREWPSGARPGQPVSKYGVRLYPEIRSVDIPGLMKIPDTTFKEKHLNLEVQAESAAPSGGIDGLEYE